MGLLTFVFSILAVLGFMVFVFLILDKYNTNRKRRNEGNSNIVIISFLLLAICSYFLALVLNYTSDLLTNASRINNDYSNLGPYGDLIGGILNPVVAFIGIIAASLAFYAQYRANAQVQRQFQIQQFESQFYEMLRLHKENVKEMKITGYDISIQEATQFEKEEEQYKSKTVTKSQTVEHTEGRKVFVTMHTELIAIYELLESYNELYKTNISKEELLSFSYKIFFFGLKSDIPSSEIIGQKTIKIFKRHLYNVRGQHKISNGEKNIYEMENRKTVELYINYSPFSGHESRLGHYYRHLYATVKFVVSKEESLFTYKEVRDYLKILRSQLSNDEQLMLYYNCIIGFGKDWESNGYLTKYRMIHNLPIDRVKYAPNPREHFLDYISGMHACDGDLFEWGDYIEN